MSVSQHYLFVPLLFVSLLSMPAIAEDAEKQCRMISALTGDYYAQRQAGKPQQELERSTPPAFAGSEFERTIALAINLAFNIDDSLSEDQVETRIFDSCMQHRR